MASFQSTLMSWLKRHPGLKSTLGGYPFVMFCLRPLVLFLARRFILGPAPNTVLHISYMVHVPWHMTRTLRQYGIQADYLALGHSTVWGKADHTYEPAKLPFVRAFQELALFWTLLARYQAIHLHFGLTPSRSSWEIAALKTLGRRIILHLRGCEARDKDRNMELHPHCNICQQCDYNAAVCSNPETKERISRLLRVADVVLVTTPDMKDFAPHAIHFPFFPPLAAALPVRPPRQLGQPLTLVHITNHPGIEGTVHINATVARLQAKGYSLRFHFLQGVSHDEALAAMAQADLAIGKMKMGYYANAQIESMLLGLPTITWVRPDLMSDALRASAFIFCSLENLEETLEYLLNNPDELALRAARTRESILELHNEEMLARQLMEYYAFPAKGVVGR